MNNRPNTANVAKGDLKSSAAEKGVKTVPSLIGNQTDAAQRDKGTRFSSVRANDSETQQSPTKKAEVEKNVKSEMADISVAEPAPESQEKKFTGRCRLFVGNLPNDLSENEFQKFFEPYGELNEVFLNASRGFGFIRLVSSMSY